MIAIRRLKHWASQCLSFNTKLNHQKYKAPLEDCPDDPDVEKLAADREETSEDDLPLMGSTMKRKRVPRRPRAFGRGRGRGGCAKAVEADFGSGGSTDSSSVETSSSSSSD